VEGTGDDLTKLPLRVLFGENEWNHGKVSTVSLSSCLNPQPCEYKARSAFLNPDIIHGILFRNILYE
jgi:hypothetical protein